MEGKRHAEARTQMGMTRLTCEHGETDEHGFSTMEVLDLLIRVNNLWESRGECFIEVLIEQGEGVKA